MNTPDGNTVSTAQLTLSLLTSLARFIPAANMSIKEVNTISLLYYTILYTTVHSYLYNTYYIYSTFCIYYT